MKTSFDMLSRAIDRLGEFGKLFVEYTGCPRGAQGRACLPLEEEVLLMPQIIDVDGGEWIPVNANALRELVARYKYLNNTRRWIPASKPPTKPGEYIVAQKHWLDGHLEAKKGKWNGVEWFIDGRESLMVAYWMPILPLPEPPTEDECHG